MIIKKLVIKYNFVLECLSSSKSSGQKLKTTRGGQLK